MTNQEFRAWLWRRAKRHKIWQKKNDKKRHEADRKANLEARQRNGKV